MSIWSEVAQQAGAVVLGAAGIVGTFLAGRSHGREGRQHARLEAAYGDLFELLTRVGEMAEARLAGRGEDSDLQPSEALFARITATVSRVALFGSQEVRDRADGAMDSVQVLLALAGRRNSSDRQAGSRDPGFEAEVAAARDVAERTHEALVEAMRRDLAVPAKRRWRR